MDQKKLRPQIKKNNEDIKERLRDGSFRIQFDSESDVFYFALTDYSPKAPVVSVEQADPKGTAALRVEYGTWKIIGFDIINWKTRFLPANPMADKAFKPFFDLIGPGDFKLEFDPGDDNPLRLYVPAQVEELLDAA